MKAYYDARAPEYDDWYRGVGRFDTQERPGWEEELQELEAMLRALGRARTLDVACGTAFLSRNLAGPLTLLDQSPRMLEIAGARLPDAVVAQADALEGLPFPEQFFDRVFAGHFYGHLEAGPRAAFVREARRVAPELVVVDSAWREGVEAEGVQERILDDGTCWTVYKRYFRAPELLDELGGGDVLLGGRWFVAVRSP